MQEGTLSLMQMAKVSVAVAAFKESKLPFISVCLDPTYGGVSASYAMQGDVRIAVSRARIGFAGPQVILNTMFNMDQQAYDEACPAGFQTAEYVRDHGQLDIVLENAELLEPTVVKIFDVLKLTQKQMDVAEREVGEAKEVESLEQHNFLNSRKLDRVQGQDILESIFENYVELRGDGMASDDVCIRGGLASFKGQACVVLYSKKGHSPGDMKSANYGMASPAGYRAALKLMRLAERFGLPLITFVDTCGAYPSFDSEAAGQSEALATNLLQMSRLKVPIITLVVGEGGSGGALAIAMGNKIAMLSNAYYAVISPEGAASILGVYESEKHKAEQFPKDAATLATIQKIYADDLLKLGVIDHIIREKNGENYQNCPALLHEIESFLVSSLKELQSLGLAELIEQRYSKFRTMGEFQELSVEQRINLLAAATGQQAVPVSKTSRSKAGFAGEVPKSLKFIADAVLNSDNSAFKGKEPRSMVVPKSLIRPSDSKNLEAKPLNAKMILDRDGPEAVVEWLKEQNRVLITDTTMRDAHQSLFATRARTVDLLKVADEVSDVLHSAFSIEMWGGATFDVCHRFLHENPWDRLRLLRERIPNVLFQMLFRGSSAVGYTNYPDNVIVEFIKRAAANGMDVFRIFDCFNNLSQMQLSIDTVRECGKIAEVGICFTGDFLSEHEKIYTLDYYKGFAARVAEAGAHMIGLKDMAGLLKPQMAKPLVDAIRSVTDLPIHFHCHNTSSAGLATTLAMADAGCEVIDFAIASMADTTSQPSMNAFLASMKGHPRDPQIDYLSLEKLDQYWDQCRTLYQPFESGLKSGTARVYDHQIPGGQYSNLIAQAKSMGTFDRWERVVDMYRVVNKMFGDIIKVTPSSKCVGDMALFMITNNLTVEDLRGPKGDLIEYPTSVVSLCKGYLGFPHHGLPQWIVKKVLKGEKQLTDRPGSLLAPVDFEALKTQLENKYGRELSQEDLLSCILYPSVMDDFFKFEQEFGSDIIHVPTTAFFYGMKIGETINLGLTGLGERFEHLASTQVTLKRVCPVDLEGYRVVVFELNEGKTVEIRVKDKSLCSSECDLPVADGSNSQHVPSPLQGIVAKVLVSQGKQVKKGDVLMVVSAMKMEVIVKALEDGVINKLMVTEGMKVDSQSLLAVIV
eukprot:TRINITY_DN3029_c0_g1_i1.p1 TRINITY_DN3029_c0_g1~~TRINITY_DN3029_c0_g1_i1.p1  ORF type:complete len:1282 (-),score=382.21 TRINITY_DN3029_c0_g1_i1:88-3519(-)